jgi:hypothetical protein
VVEIKDKPAYSTIPPPSLSGDKLTSTRIFLLSGYVSSHVKISYQNLFPKESLAVITLARSNTLYFQRDQPAWRKKRTLLASTGRFQTGRGQVVL